MDDYQCQPGFSNPWQKEEIIWIDEYLNSPLSLFVNFIDSSIDSISVKEIYDDVIVIEISKEIRLHLTKKHLYEVLTKKIL